METELSIKALMKHVRFNGIIAYYHSITTETEETVEVVDGIERRTTKEKKLAEITIDGKHYEKWAEGEEKLDGDGTNQHQLTNDKQHEQRDAHVFCVPLTGDIVKRQ